MSLSFSFHFYKIREQELRTGHVWELVPVGVGRMGESAQEGEYGTNAVYIHMYVNGKMRPAETISGMGGGRIKESDE
jgi:hypothetical protein